MLQFIILHSHTRCKQGETKNIANNPLKELLSSFIGHENPAVFSSFCFYNVHNNNFSFIVAVKNRRLLDRGACCEPRLFAAWQSYAPREDE
jgi:hypothetical protein